MINEMKNTQYFCVSFDPSVVSMSIECFDEKTGQKNLTENMGIDQECAFPLIKPYNGYLWISMAVNNDRSIKKLESGHIRLSFMSKLRSFEEAGVKCGISYDCRTVSSVETLRQDNVEFNIAGGDVSIRYSLSKPLIPDEKPAGAPAAVEKTEGGRINAAQMYDESAPEEATESCKDILRNISADLKILQYYSAYDTDGSVKNTLRSAADALAAGRAVSINTVKNTVYEAEAKLARFIDNDTELLHRYKTNID